MAKRANSGYITHVTPKKTNKTGSAFFTVQLQTEADEPTSIKVFGDHNYRRALEFIENKSPVRMDHAQYIDSYNSLVLPERHLMRQASVNEVPYLFSPEKAGNSSQSPSSGSSLKITVEDLKSHALDNTTYFTVEGKVVLGCEPPNDLMFGTVKDDAVIIDSTGWIQLKLWNEVIKDVQSHFCYQITGCKLRRSNERKIITTSPKTRITPMNLQISVPDVQFFSMQQKIMIKKISSVGEIVRSKACTSCKAAINEWMGQEMVTCEKCKDTLLTEELSTRLQVRVSVFLDGKKTDFLLREEPLVDYFSTDLSDDSRLKLGLLRTKNVTFHTKSNIVYAIIPVEIEASDDLLRQDHIAAVLGGESVHQGEKRSAAQTSTDGEETVTTPTTPEKTK